VEKILSLNIAMIKKQRIIFVSELFYPEESATAHILTKIAGQLSRDFDLLILAGQVSFDGGGDKGTPPVAESHIIRSWAPGTSKDSLLGRFTRFLALTLGLGWKTLKKSCHTDIVFAVTNPAPLLLVLAIIRKIRRFQLVFLVHDVFPENAVAAGIIRRDHLLYPMIKSLFDWAYGSADAVITIGRDMSEVISTKIPDSTYKITMIENWADHPLVELIPRNQSMILAMGLKDNIVIQYAGNIGRTQGILEFVKVVSVVNNDAVRFVFRGSGALSNSLQKATQSLHRFMLKDSYPRSDQSRVLSACDVALVILAPDMYGLGVPSKTYNIMAAGKPVLFLGPKESEIYRLIKSNDIGWAFDWSEVDQLLQLIDEWSILDLPAIEKFGNRARVLAESNFTEAAQLKKFSTLFCNLRQSDS
jgi:glycosyltransferase involved in cell wall biosynthesis